MEIPPWNTPKTPNKSWVHWYFDAIWSYLFKSFSGIQKFSRHDSLSTPYCFCSDLIARCNWSEQEQFHWNICWWHDKVLSINAWRQLVLKNCGLRESTERAGYLLHQNVVQVFSLLFNHFTCQSGSSVEGPKCFYRWLCEVQLDWGFFCETKAIWVELHSKRYPTRLPFRLFKSQWNNWL